MDLIIERLLDATRVRPSAVTEGGLGAGAWPRAEPAKQPAKQPSSLRPDAPVFSGNITQHVLHSHETVVLGEQLNGRPVSSTVYSQGVENSRL